MTRPKVVSRYSLAATSIHPTKDHRGALSPQSSRQPSYPIHRLKRMLAKFTFELLNQLSPVILSPHTYKIDDDQSGNIPKPQLSWTACAAVLFIAKTASSLRCLPPLPPMSTSIAVKASVDSSNSPAIPKGDNGRLRLFQAVIDTISIKKRFAFVMKQ